ncbi:O-antigen ligase family protein [Lacrimispora defluvii]|uniref:O-antigen ligase family protein n=1 Tax=Lacrimispora defluvii TaxID=2719233 RepID=A0ABX1VX07_9FIRM|nr:O-antigen ligase family protein [Lacrimispora defluvii]NNJ32988.1 O-antigen ligase family protein [Lacrimispora defluvii]
MTTNIYKNVNNKNNFLSVVVGIYVILIGGGLPLIVKNRYFDILLIKYYYYCFCTITMFLVAVGYFLASRIKYSFISIKRHGIKSFVNNLSLLDILVLLYWLVTIISTISSDYIYEAFWGNEGRLTGLFLITWYVVSYFYVSRFWNYKVWYIDLILFSGILVSLFGITDYFNLDIFRFRAPMISEQRFIFTSTIGNINTYTAYVGIITAIATVLFATEKNTLKIFWYYLCVVICFFAIIMGVSDNAYLSLAALFGFLPIYLFKNSYGVKKYLIILATFFTVTQCIDWINIFLKDHVLGIDSAFNVVISFANLHVIVLILWSIVAVLHYYDIKHNRQYAYYGKKIVNVWLIFLSLIIFGLLFVLYDCNIAGNVGRYSKASNYILFNDNWGTHRGYIWRNAIESFHKLSLWKKLVGYGPETFGILLLKKTAKNPYNELFDSAHNEYLHTLITVGILGLTFYVSALITFIKNCFDVKYKNTYILAIAFGVICYSVQAFVNLNIPIVTPILWLLLGMGSSKINNG